MSQQPLQQAQMLQTAMAALQAQDFAAAADGFEAALAAMPNHPGILRSLVMLRSRLGEHGKALAHAEAALALVGQDAMLQDQRLAAMARLGRAEEALGLSQTQAQSLPNAAFRQGDCLLLLQRPAEALERFEAALRHEPGRQEPARPEILTAAAEAAYRCGKLQTARGWLDQAVALEPNNRTTVMARATILLSLGPGDPTAWHQGLLDYEARLWPEDSLHIERRLNLPRWQGEPLDGGAMAGTGGHLLVCAEQGIGDQIRFATALPALLARGIRITFECAERLVPLLARNWPQIAVHAAQEKRLGRQHVFFYDWLNHNGADRPQSYIEGGSLALRLYEMGTRPDGQTRKVMAK